MPGPPLPTPDAAARFFDNYMIALEKAAIPEKQRRWHVRRVEEFIKAQAARKIKTLTGPRSSGQRT